MKTAYFDCSSGVSGDMILGALVDLGMPLDDLRRELDLVVHGQYEIEARRVARQGISGMHVQVTTSDGAIARTLGDVLGVIRSSALAAELKERSARIFTAMAQAESRVHGQDVEDVRLHEVGDLDTVVDVVGSLVGMRFLGVQEVQASPLNLGSGWVECRHGWLPVPAPMTAELVKGVPVHGTDVEAELTTPTGAAIVVDLASHFGSMPPMRVEGIGHGAGTRDLPVPNLLRVFVGEAVEGWDGLGWERLAVLEANIDDMNPEFYDYIMERLLQSGALDVFLVPVHMKKNRPGIVLSVVARDDTVGVLLDIMLRESTSLGVRVSERRRFCLPRSLRVVKTRFGDLGVKVAYRDSVAVRFVAEYDDCRDAARRYGVPLAEVYAEVQRRCDDLRWGEEP